MQGNVLRTLLLSTLLLLLIVVPLSAALSATYTADTPIQLEMAPGIFINPDLFGARLGRLEITSTQPIYNPTVLVTGIPSSHNVVLIGPLRWYSGNDFTMDYEINMNVLAVSYPNGLGGPVFTMPIKDRQPLFNTYTNIEVTVNPFIVDFYLVNSNAKGMSYDYNIAATLNSGGAEFKLDSLYVFKDPPFAPHFTIGVTNRKDQHASMFLPTGEPAEGQFIPINGNVGQGTTPVVDPSGATTDPDDGSTGFWHGNIVPDPEPVQFFFSFLSDTVSFDLNDAIGNKRKEINTANMEVVNGETGQTYKQKITFTDSGNATNFQLKSSNGTVSTIDFDLFWGSSNNPVPYGVAIDWEGLVPGINTKKLWIGGINESVAAQRLSGIYIDTIFVNITAAD